MRVFCGDVSRGCTVAWRRGWLEGICRAKPRMQLGHCLEALPESRHRQHEAAQPHLNNAAGDPTARLQTWWRIIRPNLGS